MSIKIKKIRIISNCEERARSFCKVLDHNLAVIRENRVIAESIYILNRRLLELDLPHMIELIRLRDEFLIDSQRHYEKSRRMINSITYFRSKIDLNNQCHSRRRSNTLPLRFDTFLKYLFKDDSNSKRALVKAKLVQLFDELDHFQRVQIASFKSNPIDLDYKDQVELERLASQLDQLVIKYIEKKEQSDKFEDVIACNLSVLRDKTNVLLDRLEFLMHKLNERADLSCMLNKESAKIKELKAKRTSHAESALAKEIRQLEASVTRKSDEMLAEEIESRNNLNERIDRIYLKYEDKSEEHRQATKSLIIEKRLSKQIKICLFNMAQLVDCGFRLKYCKLNSNKFFDNQISKALLVEIVDALVRFANQRDAKKRLETKMANVQLDGDKLGSGCCSDA